MTNVPSTETSDRSLPCDILYAARYYLGGSRALIVLAAVLIVGGIALNWGWLVAAGLAPILIAVLPCAVMCALGLCMHKMAGGAHTDSQSGGASANDRQDGTTEFIDPVSRRKVPADAAIATVHQRNIYYFEDRINRKAFEANPETYLVGLPMAGQQAAAPNKSSKHSQKSHGCCG